MPNARPLFDVVIHVSGTDEGTGLYDVEIIDRYHKTADVIGRVAVADLTSLDDAIGFAKGTVTAFMQGAQADD